MPNDKPDDKPDKPQAKPKDRLNVIIVYAHEP
jgi:hypothetical protein